MNGRRTIRRSLKSTVPDWSDWDRAEALTDREIENATESDPDAAPILGADWFARARVVIPPAKELISIRVDKDVLDFFRAIGRGYQTRMNAVLRAFMEHEGQSARTERLAHRQAAARKPSVTRKAAAAKGPTAKTRGR